MLSKIINNFVSQARREILSAKHKQMVDNLFNKWDNDGQGFVDNEEVDDMLSKWVMMCFLLSFQCRFLAFN